MGDSTEKNNSNKVDPSSSSRAGVSKQTVSPAATNARPHRPCTRRYTVLQPEEKSTEPIKSRNKKSVGTSGPGKVGRPRKNPDAPAAAVVVHPSPPVPEPVAALALSISQPCPISLQPSGPSGPRIMQIEVLKSAPAKLDKKALPMKAIVVKKTVTGPIMALSKMDKKPSGTSITLKKDPEGQMMETKPIILKVPVNKSATVPVMPKVEKIVLPKKETTQLVLLQPAVKKQPSPEKRKHPVLLLYTEKKHDRPAEDSRSVVFPIESSNQGHASLLNRPVSETGHQVLSAASIIQNLHSESLITAQPLSNIDSSIHLTTIKTEPVHSINQASIPGVVRAPPVVIMHATAPAVSSPSTATLPGISPPSSSVLPDICSSSSHIDETIEEVSKGNFTRSFDSDSTLTASETEQLELRMAAAAPPAKKLSTKKKKPATTEDSSRPDSVEKAKQRFKGEVAILKRSNSGSRKSGRSDATTSSDKFSANSSFVETSREPFFTGKKSKQTSSLAFPLASSTEGTEPSHMPAALTTKLSGNNGSKGLNLMREISVEVKPPPAEPKKPYFFVQPELSDGEDSSDTEELPVQSRAYGQTAPREADSSFEFAEARGRNRMRSMSIASDTTFDTISTANQWSSSGTANGGTAPSSSHHGAGPVLVSSRTRKKSYAAGGHRIGSAPLTDLGRWKPQDDMFLISAIQEYRDLALVQKHVKLSCHFSIIDIQERWFNLLYNKKISKAACQAMRACPPDVLADVERRTPFTEAEEALLLEVPILAEPHSLEVFELLLEGNRHVFHPFRTPCDLERHWRVMLSDGRVDNSDTFCVVPDEQVIHNGERILTFSEVEHRIKDTDLKNWVHVSGEFAYEMEKIQRQNRERLMNLEKEIEHIRFILSRTLNYELPDLTRPDFRSPQDRSFLAIILGQQAKYGMRTGKMSFGRTTPGKVVDMDLSLENYAGKISRLQGYIILERNGTFRIENHGRRPVFINEDVLYFGDSTILTDSSAIKVGDIYVQFFMNSNRVNRYLRQRYGGEWISEEEPEESEPAERRPKPKCSIKRKFTKLDPPRDHLLPAEASPRRNRGSKYRGRSREIPTPLELIPAIPSLPSIPEDNHKASRPKKRPPRKQAKKTHSSSVSDTEMLTASPASESPGIQLPIKFGSEPPPKQFESFPVPPPSTTTPMAQPDPVPLPPITSLPPRRNNFSDFAAIAGLTSDISAFSVPGGIVPARTSIITSRPPTAPSFLDSGSTLRPWMKSTSNTVATVTKVPARKTKSAVKVAAPASGNGTAVMESVPSMPPVTPLNVPIVAESVIHTAPSISPTISGPKEDQPSSTSLMVESQSDLPVSSLAVLTVPTIDGQPTLSRPAMSVVRPPITPSTAQVGQSIFSVPSALFPAAGIRRVYGRQKPSLVPSARPRLPIQPTQPILLDNGVPVLTTSDTTCPTSNDIPKAL